MDDGEGRLMRERLSAVVTETRPSSSTTLTIQMFGRLEVRCGDRVLGPRDFGGVKPKQVLEILLLDRGEHVPKDRLADRLWGEALPQSIAGALETYVSVLRRRLAVEKGAGHRFVVTAPEAYRFAAENAKVDLDVFDELMRASQRGDAASRRGYLEEALTLAQGDLLEDEPYADWVFEAREHYRARVQEATLEVSQLALDDEDFAAALDHAEAAIARDRHDERGYRTAMRALYALGRQHEALRAYERCRALLTEELGVDPMEETESLYDSIREHAAPRQALPVAAELSQPRRPVGAVGPGGIIGRVRELEELGSAIDTALAGSMAFVLVEGEPGVGKSRLLEDLCEQIEGATVGRTRCSPIERELPYVGLAMALRGPLAASGLDLKEWEGLGDILPELRADHTEQHGLRSLESLVELVAALGPLVLVFDDLHWADSSTIAALSYLQRRCQNLPLAILASVRPIDLAADRPVASLQPTLHTLLLPLGPEELEPLGIPGLFERTGGYMDLVAATCEQGENEELPTTVRDLLVARARAQGVTAYHALVAASVLGRPFRAELLAAILGADPIELAEELEELVDGSMLQVRGSLFDFRFELLREVLCQSISPTRRRLLRQRALKALEEHTELLSLDDEDESDLETRLALALGQSA